MSKLTMNEVKQRFAAATTKQQLREEINTVLNEDDVLAEARTRRKEINRLKNERQREIEAAELAPFEDEAKRLQHGQKVYFERRCEIDHFGFDFKFRKGARVNAGQWCRVWKYQPKAKRLWLCEPGKPAKYENVINHNFSLRDMREYGISRTEIALRK